MKTNQMNCGMGWTVATGDLVQGYGFCGIAVVRNGQLIIDGAVCEPRDVTLVLVQA